jgi:hypothetical protein
MDKLAQNPLLERWFVVFVAEVDLAGQVQWAPICSGTMDKLDKLVSTAAQFDKLPAWVVEVGRANRAMVASLEHWEHQIRSVLMKETA